MHHVYTKVLDCSLAFRFGKAVTSILARSSLCRYLCPNPDLGTAILRPGGLETNTKIEDQVYPLYALYVIYPAKKKKKKKIETHTVKFIIFFFSERPQVLQRFRLHHFNGMSLTARLHIFHF